MPNASQMLGQNSGSEYPFGCALEKQNYFAQKLIFFLDHMTCGVTDYVIHNVSPMWLIYK